MVVVVEVGCGGTDGGQGSEPEPNPSRARVEASQRATRKKLFLKHKCAAGLAPNALKAPESETRIRPFDPSILVFFC